MIRVACLAVLVAVTFQTGAHAQSASAVIAAATAKMSVNPMESVTFNGTARNGSFGQSKDIENPMGDVNVTQILDFRRTISFAQPPSTGALVLRSTGRTRPPAVPGVPAQPEGNFNQNVTGQQAASWTQALNVWLTPWGFLKAAAASNATLREEPGQKVVSFSPTNFRSPSGRPYLVTGYINDQNLVTKVETRVEHSVVGDLLVEFEYFSYRNFNGVQTPTRIVQRQGGMTTFEASITNAMANPRDLVALLTPPAPAAGAQAAPAGGGPPATAGAPPVERLAEGVFKIGGNYTSLAIDMGDHILLVESGQNEGRGLAVVAAAQQAIPNRQVRFVVNSHPHFDHAGGLAAAVAAGASVLTHENNANTLLRFLTGPRTLLGDSLSRVADRSRELVKAVNDRTVLRANAAANFRRVELLHVPNEHSDGMLAVYLPGEKILWTADVTIVNPTLVQLGVLRSVVETLNQMSVDYDSWIPAHPPSPDRPLTRADVQAAIGR